jgi:diguanylate cyclase
MSGSSSLADAPERTLEFADIALTRIRALGQPASPRHFEIWYTYATGRNPSLNQAVNELVARNGTLSDAEIDEIHATHISADRFNERMERLGTRVMYEVEQVVSTVAVAAGSASAHGESLEQIRHRLDAASSEAAVRTIADALAQTAREMEQVNKITEAKLAASKSEIAELQLKLEAIRHESMSDPLTAVTNRKFFDEHLAEIIAEAHEAGEPVSMLLTDIDHFKSFNASHGHMTGDQVLRLLANVVKQNVKGQDTVARYGGDRFAVLLPATPLRAAITVAEHIRRAIMLKELVKRSTGERLGRVTVSVAAAGLHAGDTPQTLTERAEGCLAAAKRAGRNRVVSDADPELAETAEVA